MKLTKEVVEKISSIKGEPKWMLDFRLRSLDAFLKSNNPNFGPKLDIDYDNITYYKERENKIRIVIITYCIFTISCVERHIKREVYLLTRFPYL